MAELNDDNVAAPNQGPTSVGWSVARGEALRAQRIERGLRQQELADAIGQPRTVLSNWENGTRFPSARMQAALATALRIEFASLATLSTAQREKAVDRWSSWRRGVMPLVAQDEHGRIERFIAQSDWFATLADRELAALRWNRIYAAAQPYRDQLREVLAARASTPELTAQLGAAMAANVRGALLQPGGPLPSLDVTSERCGLHLFITPLSTGPDGRLRAAATEREDLGVTVLVNASLDGPSRLLAVATLLGRLLLSPRPATVHLASQASTPRPRRVPLYDTATSFAEELLLPESAILDEVRLAVLANATGGVRDVAVRRSAVLVDLLASYGAPFPVTVRALGRAWKLSAAEIEELLQPSGPRLWRAWSRLGQAEAVALRPAITDLPGRFVALLLNEVVSGRASLQGAAELSGVDVSELRALLGEAESDPDEGWLKSGVAVA